MYDSSTIIESSANAGRRWSAGTIAARLSRTTEKIGGPHRPPNAAAANSEPYDRCGARIHTTASATVVSTIVKRRPRRSSSRPVSGCPIAAPTV
jgi:hypothetical protein